MHLCSPQESFLVKNKKSIHTVNRSRELGLSVSWEVLGGNSFQCPELGQLT